MNTSVEWDSNSFSWPSIETAEGYCIDCDRVVDIEYYSVSTLHFGYCVCAECNGNNVEFMSPVIEHLLEKIEELIG